MSRGFGRKPHRPRRGGTIVSAHRGSLLKLEPKGGRVRSDSIWEIVERGKCLYPGVQKRSASNLRKRRMKARSVHIPRAKWERRTKGVKRLVFLIVALIPLIGIQ